MTPRVHILASVRAPDLLPAATLTFQTIRTGFPSAELHVAYNDPPIPCRIILDECLKKVGAERVGTVGFPSDHHHWIAALIESETTPFFVADTDLVFWESFEKFDFSGAALAGRYTPQFDCRFANAITRPRLHTCLLYIDPVRVKEAVKKYGDRFPDIYCCPRPTLQDLVYPRYIPSKCGALLTNYFYDTTSLLFQAIGGQMFSDEQNLTFDHVQHGTLVDLVAPTYPNGNMTEFQAAVMDQPHLLKGQWKRDLNYYRQRYAE